MQSAEITTRRLTEEFQCNCDDLGINQWRCAAVHQLDAEGQHSDVFSWTAEDIKNAQQEDAELKFIIDLLQSTREKPSWGVVADQSADVKTLFAEWSRLALEDGLLLRRWTSEASAADRRQLIVPKKLRREFIQLAHTGMTGGHLGKHKTREQVSLRAYWPTWKKDVSLELLCCKDCATYHRGKQPKQTPLRPFNAGEPFEVISVDITGPHPKSVRGNEYILTVIDLFSKWSEAYAIRVHNATVVARVLMDNFFVRFGMPRRLLTDQGKEFEGILFQELCERMEIEKIRTTPYQPQTNGCVERFHRTLNSMIGKIVQYDQRNWDSCLSTVMAAYRASKHESTGFTPNRIVLGHENRAPLDIILDALPDVEDRSDNYGEFVMERERRMRDCYAIAREHLKTAARRRKDDYDSKVTSRTFEVGQWVYYFYPRKYSGRSPKWVKTYDGPFLVTKVIPPNDYVIQKTQRSTPMTVHRDKLKICYGETPRSWLTTSEGQGQTTAQGQPGADNSTRGQRRQQQPHRRSDLGNNSDYRRPAGRPAPQTAPRGLEDSVIYDDEDDLEMNRSQPARQRRLPRRFTEYLM